jgi:hypothetical protein
LISGGYEEKHYDDGGAKQGTEYPWSWEKDQEGVVWCTSTRTGVSSYLFSDSLILHFIEPTDCAQEQYNLVSIWRLALKLLTCRLSIVLMLSRIFFLPPRKKSIGLTSYTDLHG